MVAGGGASVIYRYGRGEAYMYVMVEEKFIYR